MAGGDGRLTHNLMPGEKGPQDACGVFGVWAPGEDVAKLAYFGLYALQHRGQESAGIATGTILEYVVGVLLAALPLAGDAAQRLATYSFSSQAGYLGLFGALMGALAGAVVFVLLDRRR